jgi:hypothetical protein
MIVELNRIFLYIVLPGLSSIIFFALAKFSRQILPMRALVANERTYRFAFWSFLLFGVYMGLRPLQVLAGPHPWPLIISTVREFLLIGFIGPSTFIALMSLCIGDEEVDWRWITGAFVFGILLAAVYCFANAKSIGGSHEIVKLGQLTAYDGLWYASKAKNIRIWLKIMFMIHLINPGFLFLMSGGIVLVNAVNYPIGKRRIYDNMPKKLLLISTAVYVYAFAIVIGSSIHGYRLLPDQYWIYPVGIFIAGIIETLSLAMPVRHEVQVSEHEEEY